MFLHRRIPRTLTVELALAVFWILLAGRAARADDVAAGKLLYAQHCVVCHGLKGKGDGPTGRNLNPKPTDFATATPDEPRWFKATKFGSKAIGQSSSMEAFGPKLSDAQIRAVLAYVKTLRQP